MLSLCTIFYEHVCLYHFLNTMLGAERVNTHPQLYLGFVHVITRISYILILGYNYNVSVTTCVRTYIIISAVLNSSFIKRSS